MLQRIVFGVEFGYLSLEFGYLGKACALVVDEFVEAGNFLSIFLRIRHLQLHHLYFVQQSLVLQLLLLVLCLEVGNARLQVVRPFHYGAALAFFAHQAVLNFRGFAHGFVGTLVGLRQFAGERVTLVNPLSASLFERGAAQVEHIVAKLRTHSHAHCLALFFDVDAVAHKFGQVTIDYCDDAVEHAVGQLLLHLSHWRRFHFSHSGRGSLGRLLKVAKVGHRFVFLERVDVGGAMGRVEAVEFVVLVVFAVGIA